MKKAKVKNDPKNVTIAQALNELKLLDKKITKKISQAGFVGVQVAGKARDGFKAEDATANLQSITDLMARRELIKGAINASNFNTKVTVAGKKYTVAEAIVTKDTMKYKAQLLQSMTKSYSRAVSNVQQLNDEAQYSLDAQLKGIEDKDKIKEFSESYLALRTPELVDPTNAGEYTTKLEEEILNFEDEVDYILSTSNATTTISI